MRRAIILAGLAGLADTAWFAQASSQAGPEIKGRYRDPNGSTAEFLADGTVVFGQNGRQVA